MLFLPIYFFYRALFLFLFLYLILLNIKAQTLDALDAQYGLFGVSLETHLDSLPQKKFRGKKMKKEIYILEKQPLFLGQAQLSSVEYAFYKNKLHSIILHAENAQESEKLLYYLELFYGPGVKSGLSPIYIWQGKKVKMIYEQNLLTKSCEVNITSLAMENLFQKEWLPANNK